MMRPLHSMRIVKRPSLCPAARRHTLSTTTYTPRLSSSLIKERASLPLGSIRPIIKAQGLPLSILPQASIRLTSMASASPSPPRPSDPGTSTKTPAPTCSPTRTLHLRSAMGVRNFHTSPSATTHAVGAPPAQAGTIFPHSTHPSLLLAA